MILATLEIENYKQYAGSHRIDFPEHGLVSITGPNGAGKTTLFEAIEWCLYGPRTIPLATIPPREGIGHTLVRVTFQDANDGRRFVVQRTLRKGVTAAEAYAEDTPGQPLVQGPRDVADYVSRQLVGLPHAAFVSTFFTRQKELTFFGDRTPTERRVEVGRLLGFQIVRDAQEEIAEERNLVRNRADALRAAHDEGSAGHDFDAEIPAAEAALEGARDAETAAAHRFAAADAEADRSREALDTLRDLERRDQALGTELTEIAGRIATAVARRDAAATELARLEGREHERAALVPVADEVRTLAFEMSMLDQQRERTERLRMLREAEQAEREQIAGICARLRRIVVEDAAGATGLDGWTWLTEDEAAPEHGITRLLRVVAALDARGARDRVDALRAAQTAAALLTENDRTCASYATLHDALAAQRAELLAGGDPATAMLAAQETLRQANEMRLAARDALARLEKTREDAARAARELRALSDGAACPICGGPLGPEEAERLARSRDDEIERAKSEAAAVRRNEQAAADRARAAEELESEARRRQDELNVIMARLDDGREKIQEAEAARETARAVLDAALAAAGVATPPGDAEIATARTAAETVERIAALLPLLHQLRDQVATVHAASADTRRAIDELLPVDYDESAHQTARSRLEEARAAAVRIEQIDVELASRPRYEAQREAAQSDLDALAARRRALEAERAAAGFDAAKLRRAQEQEAVARAAARSARDEAATARDRLREAQMARDRVVAERDRLEKLAAEADRAGREADELDRMYREFAALDQFVADHVGPLLSETTERLLSLVTHGKYDRVRFDENYGIEVFDGDECFKLDGFSGGERDVVALCARLAMSELVGSAALRPPRFLVLDEVFGSLDSERRGQLLETLGSLASSGRFQQMFIISHVDDVQLAPVMNEVWTIEERHGVSHVVRPELLAPAVV